MGSLSVVNGEEIVQLRPAQRRLLACLLLDPGVDLSTDKLIHRMWPGTPPGTARNTLQAHISALRRRLSGLIHTNTDGYRLEMADHEFDIPEFTGLVSSSSAHLLAGDPAAAMQAAHQALDLWRGDPYPEVADVEVARVEKTRLAGLHLSVQEILTSAMIAAGQVADSISLLQRLVTDHPFHESLWEQLVHALYLAGRQAEALRAYREVSRLLGTELGIEPSPRLRELEERILLHDPGLGSGVRMRGANNLPLIGTSFVGRQDEVGHLLALIDRHRVVSITGGPGMGKTRLAIEVGGQALERFPGGVWLARLVGASTEADVSAIIASATGMAADIENLEQLRANLAGRPCLLLLDNCEHVVTAVRAFLGGDGADGPFRVLVTSRTTLGIEGEWVWRLEALTLPEEGKPEASPALRLFADRVAAMDRSFSIGPANVQKVTELCRRTAGIPLALELAASWVPSLSLDEIGALGLEEVGNRALPSTPHHESLAVAIEWSLNTLASTDRALFDAAAIFAGSFDFDAFRHVCLDGNPRLQSAGALARLVESSLLTTVRSADGQMRYRMLEPLREHGLDRLRRGGRSASIRDRHAGWFLSRAADVARLAKGPSEATSFLQLDEEIADFRAAMRHLFDSHRPSHMTEVATALSRYWFARYQGREAHRWLDEALRAELTDSARLSTLAATAWAAYSTASYAVAEDRYEECLDLARSSGDRRWEGEALYGLARIHLTRRYRDGESLLHDALFCFDEIGAEPQAAECRLLIGLKAANAGETSTARRWLEKAVENLDRCGYKMLVSVGHRYLSLAAWYADDEEDARRHLEIAERVARATDDQRAIGGALIQRGLVEGRWGDRGVAAAAIIGAIKPIPPNSDIDYCLVFFGAFPALIADRRWVMAARLFDHLDRIYDQYGWIPIDDRLPAAAEFRAAIREGLESSNSGHDAVPVSSAEMAAELIETLKLVETAPTAGFAAD